MGLATMHEVRAARQQGMQITRRAFEGAQINRLTMDLSSVETRIDQEIQAGGKALRARARTLALNNEYIRRYLQLFVVNVVGPSFRVSASWFLTDDIVIRGRRASSV